MSVLVWLEYRRLINFIRYSIRSPKRLLIVLLVAAGFTPNLVLLYHGGRTAPSANAALGAALGRDPALMEIIWLAAFLISALLLSAWPQSGLNSRFGQLAPSDRDFLLPAPVPGYAILIARALKLTLAWGFFVAWGMAYWIWAGRHARGLDRIGVDEWSLLVPCVFAAFGLGLAALAYSLRDKSMWPALITAAGWAGALVVIVVGLNWGREIMDAFRPPDDIDTAPPPAHHLSIVERVSASPWRFAALPSLAVADAIAPKARSQPLPGPTGAALLAGMTAACCVAVVRLTKTLWDPATGMGRLQSTMLALGGRSRSAITGMAISQPALRHIARLRIPFGNHPFGAIFTRELMLALRRVLPMYVLLLLAVMLALGAAGRLSPEGFEDARPEIRWASMAFLPYVCVFMLASHLAVARNRARALDQDRNIPMPDRDRVAAQVLAPALVYFACVGVLAVAVFSFAGFPAGSWMWLYVSAIAAMALLGSAVTHMSALLYPGTEAGEHFMSLFVMGPIALAAVLFVAVPTVISGAAGGFGPLCALSCLCAAVLAFVILASAAAKIAPDPTSAAEE